MHQKNTIQSKDGGSFRRCYNWLPIAALKAAPEAEGKNSIMLREYHKSYSRALERDMEMLIFGHAGARILAFPTSCGRFFDWENFGLVESLGEALSRGWFQLFCLDSVDVESWWNQNINPEARLERHLAYQKYVIEEALPLTESRNSHSYSIAAGCSFGAYHSANLALRFPDRFNRVLGMSGVYEVRTWTDNRMDDQLALGSPSDLISKINDQPLLEQIRSIDWILPTGAEDPLLPSNEDFSQALKAKGVPHHVDIWDGNCHDWLSWSKMLPKYIGGVPAGQTSTAIGLKSL